MLIFQIQITSPRTPRISEFELKMMVKSGIDFSYFEFPLAPLEIPFRADMFALGSSNFEGASRISR